MMKNFLTIVISVCLLIVPTIQARAAEIDVLLDKLVEKGVLTPLEAQIVKDETKQDVAKQVSTGKMDTLPSWIQTIKLKGDFRLRFQTDERASDSHWRNRGRYRLRLGAYAQPHPDLGVGLRIATGESSDSRSTNETMGDNFSKDDLWIDLAYAEYTPAGPFKIIGGKFKRSPYLWTTTDLLWDGDINPEGVSVHAEHALRDNVDVFGNVGSWLISEISDQTASATDPFLYYFQGGVQMKSENMDAKVAGIYYGFNGIQGQGLANTANSNTMSGGKLVYDYDSVGASAEIGVKKLFGGLPKGIDNRIAVFGDYIKNISNGVSKDQGFSIGAKLGHKKVSKPGTWQMKYIYAQLEKDAFIDAYPDSDRYGGATDIKSHELIWNYALKKDVILGLDYYRSNTLDAASDVENLFQADFLVKF